MGWRYVSLSVRNKKLNNGNRYCNDDNNHHNRNRHNNRNDQQDAIIRRRRRIRMKFVASKCETVSALLSCHNSAFRIGGLRGPMLIHSSFARSLLTNLVFNLGLFLIVQIKRGKRLNQEMNP